MDARHRTEETFDFDLDDYNNLNDVCTLGITLFILYARLIDGIHKGIFM